MNESKIIIVAGGAGFIGSNLCRELIKKGNKVIIADNFSLGSKKNLSNLNLEDPKNILDIDLSDIDQTHKAFNFVLKYYSKIDSVWHMAANSDIPAGVDNPFVDHKDTFLTTFMLLEACKKFNVKEFNFASSSAVYGDWGSNALSEELGPLRPISNYGAMKLASEAQICSARESFLDSANIFRFPNVVGSPATHGVIFDFINKLKKDKKSLRVLGNGSQKKSYLHVDELINAMLYVSDIGNKYSQANIINIGCDDEGILVSDIAKIVVGIVSPDAKIKYGDDSKGWVGDVPRFYYDISKLRSLGWSPLLNSYEAVRKAAHQIYADLR